MKKLILLLPALLIAVGLSAQSYIPVSPYQTLNLESFRHQSTAVIEDDLDNGIDGTDIFKVEGGRIFTNLSNLTSGKEELMDNYSDNTLLIGATSPEYKNWKATLIYGYTKGLMSSSNFTTQVEQWDNNADDTLDFMGEIYNDQFNEYSDFENCLLLNIGKKMGKEELIAFTYKRMNSENASNYKDSQYVSTTDLGNNDVLNLTEEYITVDSSRSVPSNLYTLSYSKPFREWRLRGDIFLLSGSMKSINKTTSYYFQDLAPSDTAITNTSLDTSLYTDKEELTANLAGISARLSDINDDLLWEVTANFGMIFGSGDDENLNITHEVERGMSAGNVYTDENITDYTNTAPISVSGSNMGIDGRMEWQLSENVRFGLGLILNRLQYTNEYDIDETQVSRIIYDDGDEEPDDADDYVVTTTEGSTVTLTDETTWNSITVPAGIELNFGKNKDWFLRLGALATNSKVENSITEELGDIDRRVTTLITDAGDTTVTYNDEINYSLTDRRRTSHNETVNFVYGLGWKPSPNLSIDLMGIFDENDVELLSTEWFKSLKLSATVSFD